MVSVIIPVYNRLLYLQAAIESVLAQTYQVFEIIVVDDGSIVDVMGVLRPFMGRVSYLRQEHRGVAAARNLGVSASRGEYLAFLDSDDIFMPAKLERQLTDLLKNSQVAMAYSDEFLIDNSGNTSSSALRVKRTPPLPSGCIAKDFFVDSFIGTMTVFLRRSVFDEVGGFDESMLYNEDDDLWLRIMLKYPVICSGYVSGARRIHDTNMSRDRSKMVYYQLKCIGKYIIEYKCFCFDNNAIILTRINSLLGDYLRWSLKDRRIPSLRVLAEYFHVFIGLKRLLGDNNNAK
jgi:glycosyltransferase involved in cell wall biosynthesis